MTHAPCWLLCVRDTVLTRLWPLGTLAEKCPPSRFFATARRLMGGATSVLVIAVVIQAWRTRRGQTAIVRAATAAGVLLLAAGVIGASIAVFGFDAWLKVAYMAVAAALWAVLVVLVVMAGLAPTRLIRTPLTTAQTMEGIDRPPEG